MDGRKEGRKREAQQRVEEWIFFCCGRYLGEVSRYMYLRYVCSRQDDYFIQILANSSVSISFYFMYA